MEKLAEKIKDAICKYNPDLTCEQQETIRYGLECALNEVSKTLVYLIIFSLLSLTGHFLIAMVFFCTLRSFAGGYHAETFTVCFFVTLIILSMAIFAGSLVGVPFAARIVLLLISIVLIWLYAPVDHPNKPIISPVRRKRFKYLSLVIFTILAGITFLLDESLASTAVVILFLEALSLPVGQISKGRVAV